jgi:NAD(P) transhydrogenase subunit alpha
VFCILGAPGQLLGAEILLHTPVSVGHCRMKIVVPKEIAANEHRVALVPDAVAPLTRLGLQILVQSGAGADAFFSDADYEKAGATVVCDAAKLFAEADVVLKIQKPTDHEAAQLREGAVTISFLQPASSADLISILVKRKITAFSMELVPRISRAQKMDALSSQANLAGYKAVLIAAASLGKYFPMLMTAAGTIPPAKVLVLGAGVAGLQAIATGRRLGAQVWGYDVRPAVKEQVESLGAKFLEFQLTQKDTEDKGGYAKELCEEDKKRQQQWLADQTKEFDVVVTTAAIPGKKAPILITKETVERMRAGSVIVDLAAETGGNCELTEAGKVVVKHGVTIHGPVNLPATMPIHASQMYARNISELLKLLIKNGQLNVDFKDEIIKGACVTHDGKKLIP